MPGRNIKTNLDLRLRGWQAAAKSPKTPKSLRKSIQRNIKALRRRLRIRKSKKSNGLKGGAEIRLRCQNARRKVDR